MKSLAIGQVLVARCRVPACHSCRQERGTYRSWPKHECLCQGTGGFAECDGCKRDMIGDFAECFEITVPRDPMFSHKTGWEPQRHDYVCFSCLGHVLAEELPELRLGDEEHAA